MVTLLLVILGFFAGLLGALTGIGGGVLLTPILALHFGIPIRQAIGTSLVAVITTSAASSSVHLQRHTTDIRLGMTLELATSFGAAVTAYLVGYFNRNALEGLFAGFLLYSAITIMAKGGKVKPLEDEPVPALDPGEIPPYEPKRYPLGLAGHRRLLPGREPAQDIGDQRPPAAVAWSTTSRPAAVTDTCTARRSARARCRRIRPLRSSRSHIRPAVGGVTSSAAARSPTRCGPREASTTSARYWAIVVSSAAAPSDRVATATRVRLAVSTASTAASSATCSVTPGAPHFICLLQ